MKKSLVLLAGASLAFLGLPAVSHAQAASGPFADVPTDHWAYQSVDTLQKAGIVIGYPDGTYGGRRPMTRYEFAVAIARLMGQIKPDLTGYAKTGDLDALRTELTNRIAANEANVDALKTLVNGFAPELARLGQNVADLNARLDALTARVNGIDGRLRSVEDEVARVKITGTINLIGRGNVSNEKTTNGGGVYAPFLDKNGTYLSQGSTLNNFNGNNFINIPAGFPDHRLLGSTSFTHDVLLNIRGKLTDTAVAVVALDFGNYLQSIGNTANFGYLNSSTGNFNGGNGNGGFVNTAGEDVNVYKAYLDAAVKLGPLGGADLLVGRTGNQFTKYTLMLPDADVYTNVAQTDSGEVIMDGAQLKFKLGPANLATFAGKNTNIPFQQLFGGSANSNFGVAAGLSQVRPGGQIASNHAAPFDQGAGLRATFGAPEGAVLGVTVEQFGLNTTNNNNNIFGFGNGVTDPNRPNPSPLLGQGNAQYDRLSVYGVDFNGALPIGLPGVKKGGILVDASYTVSAHGLGHGFNNIGNDFRYQSTDDQIGFAVGPVLLKGGYQYVGPDFSAPGYWGKVGAWTNPTNIKGPVVSAKFAITPKLAFNADFEAYKAAYGTNKNGTTIDSPLQSNDHLNRYQVGLSYGLSSAYDVGLGYESVNYDLRNNTVNGFTPLTKAGHPTESYTTFGVGHTLSPNASIKLEYQIVHYDDRGTGFDPISEAVGNNGHTDGGVAITQFQLKF